MTQFDAPLVTEDEDVACIVVHVGVGERILCGMGDKTGREGEVGAGGGGAVDLAQPLIGLPAPGNSRMCCRLSGDKIRINVRAEAPRIKMAGIVADRMTELFGDRIRFTEQFHGAVKRDVVDDLLAYP